jgi:hypothetical protein
MTYGQSEILEHNGTIETLNEMNIINRIHGLWKNYKKKNLLKSFDEVEENVFVLKQEITNRLKLKLNRIRKRKLNKRNMQ